jgi:hypothetical protein
MPGFFSHPFFTRDRPIPTPYMPGISFATDFLFIIQNRQLCHLSNFRNALMPVPPAPMNASLMAGWAWNIAGNALKPAANAPKSVYKWPIRN